MKRRSLTKGAFILVKEPPIIFSLISRPSDSGVSNEMVSSRRYSPRNKPLLLQHREHVNGGRTGAYGPGSVVFLFQKVINKEV